MDLMVNEKKILILFSYCKSLETIDPQGKASLDPRGSIGRIYVGDH